MLNDTRSFQALLRRFLDTSFHLPTLVTIALISLIILWTSWDAGIHIGSGFIRLHTNQGNITLEWLDGCCDLDW